MNKFDYDKYKPFLTDYVNSITTKSPKNKSNYICPMCKSGEGPNGTGGFSIFNGGNSWHCFSCGRGGDIFNLYQYVNKCDKRTAENAISEMYDGVTPTPIKEEPKKQVETPEEIEHKLDNWNLNIITGMYDGKGLDYFIGRGFSLDTVKRFNLGYDGRNAIIPCDRHHYIVRGLEGNFKQNKPDGAEVQILDATHNDKGTLFICEAWADALSIWQLGYNAISVNSSNNSRKAIPFVKCHNYDSFVIAYDNDQPGKHGANDMRKLLEEMGKQNYIEFDYSMMSEEKNDINDYFTSDKEELRKACDRMALEANKKPIETQNNDIYRNILDNEKGAHTAKMDAIACNLSKYKRSNYSMNVFDNEDIFDPIPTGFNELDDNLGGGLYPGITILGASSSLGKTTFAMNIAENLASNKKHVLYFSLEMTERQMYSKALARKTAQMFYSNYPLNAPNASKISRLHLTKEQRYQVEQARRELDETSGDYMTVIPGKEPLNVNDIIEYIEDYRNIYNVTPIVFIDYLQIIEATSPYQKDIEKLNEIVSKLKRLQLNNQELILFIISSFNRKSYDEEIEMDSFKGSGNIEYTADVVMGLKLEKGTDIEEKKPRSIELYALKNRQGKQKFQTNFTYFSNCDYYERRALNLDKPTQYGGKWSQEKVK